jgi:hypothetical protein
LTHNALRFVLIIPERTGTHHFFQALPSGTGRAAVRYARQAGERAFAAHAHEEAARLYDTALQSLDALGPLPRDESKQAAEVERCDLLLALGEARVCAGDLARGREAVHSAAGIARSLGSPAHVVRAALAYGIEVESGHVDPFLVDLLEEALARLPEGDSAERFAAAIAELGQPQPFDADQALTLVREAGGSGSVA